MIINFLNHSFRQSVSLRFTKSKMSGSNPVYVTIFVIFNDSSQHSIIILVSFDLIKYDYCVISIRNRILKKPPKLK